MDLSFSVYLAILAATVAGALLKGGAPERYGAFVLLLMASVQYPKSLFLGASYQHLDWLSLIEDAVAFAGFLAIALYARRLWPIWAASLQLISCVAHVTRAAQSDIEALAYAVMKAVPSGLMILVLGAGTILHLHRLRTRGEDPSWLE